MRALLVALCLLAACKKSAPSTPPPSASFDERQACSDDAECAVVELECCDHCNGGAVVGVHKDVAADVRREYAPASECSGVACTLRGCVDEPQPICRAGRCGISIGGAESLPPLPPP